MIALLCAALAAASPPAADAETAMTPSTTAATAATSAATTAATTAAANAAKTSMTAPTQGTALASAYRREVALLEAEKAALAAALDKVRAQRAERAAGERKAIAMLEAALVAVRAENEGVAARIAGIRRRGSVDEDGVAASLGSLRRALGGAGLEDAARAVTLPEILEGAVAELARGSEVRRVASGFFSADGRFVSGTVVDIGRLASVGASATAGGPLAILDDVRQVSDEGYAEDAQRFVDGAGPAPVRLSPAPSATEAGEPSSPWVVALPAVFALLAGAGFARWLRLRSARRGTAAASARARGLVREGDAVAARAVAASAPDPAGALLSSIMEASTVTKHGDRRSGGEALDDVAAEAWLDAAGAVDRGDRRLLAAALAATLAAAAVGLHVGALSEVRGALEAALVLGAVVVVALAGARGEASALKRELERAALGLVDAVRRAREGA